MPDNKPKTFTAAQIHEGIVRAAQQHMPDSSVVPDFEANIFDLGMDSLDVIGICFELEGEFEIEVPDEVVDGFKSLKDVEDYLLKELKHVG